MVKSLSTDRQRPAMESGETLMTYNPMSILVFTITVFAIAHVFVGVLLSS